MAIITENGIKYYVRGDYPDGKYEKEVVFKGDPPEKDSEISKDVKDEMSKTNIGKVVLAILDRLGMNG